MALFSHGKRLQAGNLHSKANFHMVVQLPSGIASTRVRFVDCTPSCSTGEELYSTNDVTTDVNIRVKSLDEGAHLYDIQYAVPVEQQRPHILMAVRASDCSSTSCESTEESFLDCRPGSIKVGESCTECDAGEYQSEGECAVCVAGRASSVGSVKCHKCPSGHTSLTGAAECERCTEGFYALSGDSECIECPLGRVSDPGSSSCESGPPAIAELRVKMVLFGVSRTDVESTVRELTQVLKKLVGAPVEIVSVGGEAVSRRRRLFTSVEVEYRVLVTQKEQLAEVEERTRRLQESTEQLVTEFKSLVRDVLDVDVDAITVSVGKSETIMLLERSIFTFTNMMYVLILIAVASVALSLYTCRTTKRTTHSATPLHFETFVGRRQKKCLVLEPLIKVQNLKKIKF